jgi:hypothetical protein
MNSRVILARTLSVLGSVLIICSLIGVLIIGFKAKNLMITGTGAGIFSWVLAWLINIGKAPLWSVMGLMLAASLVFAQRCLANFWAVIGIVQQQASYDAKNKCTLIILLMLMTIASLTSFIIAFVFQASDQSKNSE